MSISCAHPYCYIKIRLPLAETTCVLFSTIRFAKFQPRSTTKTRCTCTSHRPEAHTLCFFVQPVSNRLQPHSSPLQDYELYSRIQWRLTASYGCPIMGALRCVTVPKARQRTRTTDDHGRMRRCLIVGVVMRRAQFL